MCREFICKIFGCKEQQSSIPKPNNLEDINSTEVSTILKAEFPQARVYISDNKYKTTTVGELESYLKYDIVDSHTYISEFFDCDDFSFALMGELSNPSWGCLSFGIMWTDIGNNNKHAVNCFIDKDRAVWIVEPQSDGIFKLPNGWVPYMIMM
jgi:hypothetical protein